MIAPDSNAMISYYEHPVLVDQRTYPSISRQMIVDRAALIRNERGGEKYSRLFSVAEAVAQLIPYDYSVLQNLNASIPADNMCRATQMIISGVGGVCRQQAPILTQGLRDVGFPNTVQVWFDVHDEKTGVDWSHTQAYVPERERFVNPGREAVREEKIGMVLSLHELVQLYQYNGMRVNNFKTLNSDTNIWENWFHDNYLQLFK